MASTQLIIEKQDLTHLSWAKIRHSSGTAGSFLKAYSDLGGQKTYYKLSNFDNTRGIVGHECVNELIVDRLLTILGIEHLSYQLIHADIVIRDTPYTTWLCASQDFKQPRESKIAFDVYYEAEHAKGESPLDFCERNGWTEFIDQMLVVDYLILNRDRHGANIEVLRNSRKKTLRLAPLFDHGLSLLCRCETPEQIAAFDVMADTRVQSYVASQSARDNLNLIPPNRLPILRPLREEHRAILMEGLDHVIPSLLQNRIWDMIWGRWQSYEALRDQR